jgi:phosphoribosyl 1,2-cyclic phosphodiesterase
MFICVVDDVRLITDLTSEVLTKAGHTVKAYNNPKVALAEIPLLKPDLVIVDIMMSEMDGLDLCEQLCAILPELKVIVLSAKPYQFDRNQAQKAGAIGYIVKPFQPATLNAEIMAILKDSVTIRYWGLRGTLPVPGRKSLIYGGNTICVTLEFPRDRHFIFDAGTGIKELSNHLMASRSGKWSARLFISHPHWDHINAIPFFTPMYIPGNEFEIIGARHGQTGVQEMVSDQMDGIYFPVTIREMNAKTYFKDIEPGTYEFDDIEVKAMYLSHPGKCLGYRVNYDGRSFCYITDNEIYPADTPYYNPQYEAELIEFIRDADVAMMDTCYFEEEYRKKITWGHSSVNEVVRIAHAAGVRELQLFHHDPDQDDARIEAKGALANQLLAAMGSKTVCTVPREGDTVILEQDKTVRIPGP